MITLPVGALLPEIVATLRGTRRLVLEAPPGAGRTTRGRGSRRRGGHRGGRRTRRG